MIIESINGDEVEEETGKDQFKGGSCAQLRDLGLHPEDNMSPKHFKQSRNRIWFIFSFFLFFRIWFIF